MSAGSERPARRLAVLGLLLALLGAVLAAVPTAVATSGSSLKKSALAIQGAPGTVTVFANGAVEQTGVLVSVSPARSGRAVTFQRRDDDRWTTVKQVATDAGGRAFLDVVVTELGTTTYRAKVAKSRGYRGTSWKTTNIYTRPNTACSPVVPLVDGAARGEVSCLASRLDRWQAAHLMGIGQQVNVSGDADKWLRPLDGIPAPSVLGFDLEELDYAATKTDYPYAAPRIAELIERAHDGAVLVASWHAVNPLHPSKGSNSARLDLAALLDPDTVAHQNFWADWDAKLNLLQRFQDDDANGDGISDHSPCWCTPVVVRPLHEVNGGFFWWGKPKASVYRQVYAELQAKAAARGVHNVLWAYSGNRYTSSTKNPAAYVPQRVDLGGLDTYDPEQGKGNGADVLPVEGYSAIAKKVQRMALTEVGPHGSADKKWNPKVIEQGVRRAKIQPLWAMLWFDDGSAKQARSTGVLGYKQLNSLIGGKSWLTTCFNGLCSLK